MNVMLERLINTVLQSSKAIKNQTELSGGTISVSFAAIQYIRENVKAVPDKNILVLGTGKIGKSTSEKSGSLFQDKEYHSFINRTEEKAAELAKELGLKHAPISELPRHISGADIILVATDSTEPTILLSHLEKQSHKLILDLSVL